MIYIENVFVCIAAPLLVAMLTMGKKYYYILIFCFAGMGACLLSAYINSFFVHLYSADFLSATSQIAPVVEEVMKLLPLLFYLLIFEPKSEKIRIAVLIVAISFATFENICYLTQHGASDLTFLLIRSFGTGAMHIVCGAIVGYGLVFVWQHTWLKTAGTASLLCTAITFHAIYNLLIAHGSSTQYLAYALPILTLLLGGLIAKLVKAVPQN